MSVSDYPYSSTGGALLWRMLLRSLSLWSQFGPCVQLRHLPTTMIHCWFKILLCRCLSWSPDTPKLEFVSKQDSFSVIHCEIQVLLSQPEASKRVDLLMVLSLWLCRIVLWIHPISFLWREKLELRHNSNDFWPPSFIYSLNPQTFCLFPSFRDNTRNCRRGLRLLDPRLTTTHTLKQEQKVVKKKYS